MKLNIRISELSPITRLPNRFRSKQKRDASFYKLINKRISETCEL